MDWVSVVGLCLISFALGRKWGLRREKDVTSVIAAVVAVVGVLVVMFPLLAAMALLVAMWRAWWLYPGWAWFVVPLGLPPISFWHFVALLTLISFLHPSHVNHKKDERKTDWGSLVGVSAVGPPLAWVVMWWIAGR